MLTTGWYRFYGWLFFLTTLPSIILHLIVIVAIFKIPTFNQRVSLRILFFIRITDCAQTIIHCISGVVTILRIIVPYNVNTILGFSLDAFWESVVFLQLFLGIDRLYIITRNKIVVEDELKYFDWPVVIAWFGSSVYVLLYWISGKRIHYDFELLGWPDTYANFTIMKTKLVFYLYNADCAVIFMGYRRRNTASTNRTANSSTELKMLIQISITYMMYISSIILWNIFENAPVEFQALLTFEVILFSALPPYFNLIVSGRSVVELIAPFYRKISKASVSRTVLPKMINTRLAPEIKISTTSNSACGVDKSASKNSKSSTFSFTRSSLPY